MTPPPKNRLRASDFAYGCLLLPVVSLVGAVCVLALGADKVAAHTPGEGLGRVLLAVGAAIGLTCLVSATYFIVRGSRTVSVAKARWVSLAVGLTGLIGLLVARLLT